MIKIENIIGHRGVAGYMPENTESSIRYAKLFNVSWIEIDVTSCLDELVVFHDATLNRITNYKGEIKNFSISFLKKIDICIKNYKKEKILTLQEAIDIAENCNINVNIEIKYLYPSSKIDKLIDKILYIINNRKISFILSSFSLQILEIIQKKNSRIAISLIINKWNNICLNNKIKKRLFSLHINYIYLNKIIFEKITKNITNNIFAYTVNKKNIAKKLFLLGVKKIFSDMPNKLL